MPSRAVATVCPHRGRGGLGPEGQRLQNRNRVVLLDFLGFGPLTAAARPPQGGLFDRIAPADPKISRCWPTSVGQNRSSWPERPTGGWIRGRGCPFPSSSHGGQVPPAASFVAASPPKRPGCFAFFSVNGRSPHASPPTDPFGANITPKKARRPLGEAFPKTCSIDPTLVREFFNPLPRVSESSEENS